MLIIGPELCQVIAREKRANTEKHRYVTKTTSLADFDFVILKYGREKQFVGALRWMAPFAIALKVILRR